MIKYVNGNPQYFDKNNTRIVEGCKVRVLSGEVKKIYLTADGELGTDATRQSWIDSGRAAECEYGIYPLTLEDTDNMVVVDD